MTITIHASNIGCLVKADIEVSPIALIAGRNAMGKSSLCLGAAAVLTGQPLAATEVAKKDAAMLVRDGAKMGQVQIVTAEGVAAIEWPECQLATKGPPPQASIYAAGIASIATTPRKERLVALEPYMQVSPTKTDLVAELEAEDFDPAIIDQLWEVIERDGWDATHKRQVDNRARTAGQWEAVTGQRFGSQKAKSWQPEGWYPGLAEYSDEELEQRVVTAHQQVEEAIANQAVDTAEVARLQALVDQIPTLQAKLLNHAEALKQAETELQTAKEARAALPATGGAEVPVPCLYCGGLHVIERDLATLRLRKYTIEPEAKTKAVREKVAAAMGAWERCQAEAAKCRRAHEAAEKDLTTALQAQTSLEAAAGRQGAEQAVETARLHDQNARQALAISRQMRKAEEARQKWELLQIVIDILAPTGLRQKKLGVGIAKLNKRLAKLCEVAGWPAVMFTEDLNVVCGPEQRPYSRIGKSRQFRVRVILQMAMALLDGSTMVVIDEADILDNAGREQLFGLLGECDVPALVAMTLSRPAVAPDLTGWEIEPGQPYGATWWVQDGIVSPLTEALQQAA